MDLLHTVYGGHIKRRFGFGKISDKNGQISVNWQKSGKLDEKCTKC